MQSIFAIEQIEKYINGTLSAESLKRFEEELASNSAFALEVRSHKEFMEALSIYGNRKTLKEKMQRLHRTMEQERIVPLTIVHTTNKIRAFIRYHLSTAAVAASVTIISVLATYYTVSYFNNEGKQKQSAFYQSLKRDIDNIRTSQRALINDINETKSPVRYEDFGGTGFAISSDGYILTSFHLIKGADSVVIENKKYSRLRVKEIMRDSVLDIALLKVEDVNFKSFETLPYSLKKNVTDPGETVFTLGYPREDIVYGEGSISSRSGFNGDSLAYQISIPLNPGNSGGPLFDEQGNLIGLISGKNIMAEGTSFAVKTGYIMDYIDSLPLEHLPGPVLLPAKTTLKNFKRSEQISRIEDAIFMVKVYNKLP